MYVAPRERQRYTVSSISLTDCSLGEFFFLLLNTKVRFKMDRHWSSRLHIKERFVEGMLARLS